MQFDEIKITILKDGTIKVVTDPISGPNHYNAEQFLSGISALAGGTTTREPRSDRPHHHHTEEEGHVHN